MDFKLQWNEMDFKLQWNELGTDNYEKTKFFQARKNTFINI